MIKELKNFDLLELKSKGFVSNIFRVGAENVFIESLLTMTRNLGTPVPSRFGTSIYDILQPIERINVSRPSLSKVFSSGEFPLHTDGAHWTKPPRYIILACFSPGDANRSTLILDTK